MVEKQFLNSIKRHNRLAVAHVTWTRAFSVINTEKRKISDDELECA